MKVFAFVISLGLFLGGLALFGFAFDLAGGWNTAAFVAGIVAISVSLMIPFHLLERFD